MSNSYSVVTRAVWLWMLVLFFGSPALALNFEYGEAQFTLNSRAVIGGALRLQSRNPNTLGKLNVNPDLCPDDCISFTGGANPSADEQEPNQRLVDAPGAFLGNNFDNGNLNYDKYDFVSAQVRLESEFIAQYGKTSVKVSGIGFYDRLNNDFNDFHPDTAFQPPYTPRSGAAKHRVGADYDLLEAFVSRPFEVFDQRFTVTVGEQRLRWGESTFVALGSLDQWNPPDQVRLNFPGSEISSVFEPVGLAVVSTNLSANVALEAVYQYRWEGAQPAAADSFYGTNDIAGGGDYAVISLGQFSEDPNFIGTFQNDVPNNISNSSTSVPVDDLSGEPSNSGQFGARLTWFAENINDGTEFGFYAMNYHSRLPYASTFATDRSCLRDGVDLPLLSTGEIGDLLGIDLDGLTAGIIGALPVGVPVPTEGLNADALTALAACGGGTGTGGLAPALQAAFGPANGGVQEEPIPIDTLRPFLDYPEDIHLFGIAFNTQFGRWSVAGEYVFQPNLPLQVALSDVIFAGVQPALPEQDLNLVLGIIPSNRNAAPDAIETQFRGNTVTANQRIRGYTREKVHQLDLTGIRVFSSTNWIGADQIILLTELGITYVQDLPGSDTLRYEGGGPNCTHFSAGADGTGSDTGPDARRLNPTQSLDCFADDLAAGYRIFIRPQYNNLVFGWTFNPIIGFFHDFYGVSPFPAQNFVEDEIEVLLGTDITFTNSLSMQVLYQGFFESGDRTSLVQDRDNVQMSFSYNF